MAGQGSWPAARPQPLLLRFRFTEDGRNQLAKLKVGQQVSVEGEVKEPSEGKNAKIEHIEFDHCKIINANGN